MAIGKKSFTQFGLCSVLHVSAWAIFNPSARRNPLIMLYLIHLWAREGTHLCSAFPANAQAMLRLSANRRLLPLIILLVPSDVLIFLMVRPRVCHVQLPPLLLLLSRALKPLLHWYGAPLLRPLRPRAWSPWPHLSANKCLLLLTGLLLAHLPTPPLVGWWMVHSLILNVLGRVVFDGAWILRF